MDSQEKQELVEQMRRLVAANNGYIKWHWYLVTTATIVVTLLSSMWMMTSTKVDMTTFTTYVKDAEYQHSMMLRDMEQIHKMISSLYSVHIDTGNRTKK